MPKKKEYTPVAEVVKAQTCGDTMAKVIEDNMPLVYNQIQKLRGNGRVPYEDQIAEGRAAIINAIYRFDAEKSKAWTTYLYWYVRGQLLNQLNGVYYKNTVSSATKRFGEDSSSTLEDLAESDDPVESSDLMNEIMHLVDTKLTDIERTVFLEHSGIVKKKRIFEEIAKDLGKSKMGICKAYHRAQKKLQSSFTL